MKEKTGGFLAEFRTFISRGSVMDLAVGVIIGGAFKGITDSLVNDILNPILGIFAGGNEALTGLAISVPGGGAVGVIIGGAFKGITDSLVNDILNPILGIFAGGNEALTGLAISVPGGGQVLLGSFINAVLNFLIMAFVIFCLIKAMNRLHKKKEEAPPAPPAPSKEEVLLTEIRDLLKARKEDA